MQRPFRCLRLQILHIIGSSEIFGDCSEYYLRVCDPGLGVWEDAVPPYLLCSIPSDGVLLSFEKSEVNFEDGNRCRRVFGYCDVGGIYKCNFSYSSDCDFLGQAWKRNEFRAANQEILNSHHPGISCDYSSIDLQLYPAQQLFCISRRLLDWLRSPGSKQSESIFYSAFDRAPRVTDFFLQGASLFFSDSFARDSGLLFTLEETKNGNASVHNIIPKQSPDLFEVGSVERRREFRAEVPRIHDSVFDHSDICFDGICDVVAGFPCKMEWNYCIDLAL